MDFNRVFEVLTELSDFVSGEPRLSAFGPGVTQVRDQARALARGEKQFPSLPNASTGAIPDRALAERLVEIISRMPEVNPDEVDRDSLRMFAQLNANLFSAIVFAIFSSFPDVIPRQRPMGRS